MTDRRHRQRTAGPLLGEEAVGIAREALEDLGEGPVGAHVGVTMSGHHAAVHRFAADLPGYRGWEWAAVVAAAPGSRRVTVSEVALLPGDRALRPPEWVPYEDRVRPGDLGPGDILPPAPDDPRLAPNPGNPHGEVGRPGKVLTEAGLQQAAERWSAGPTGPHSDSAKAAELRCRTCAFLVPLTGGLGERFGACTNEYSADGLVVSMAHGCGAHADTPPRGSARGRRADA